MPGTPTTEIGIFSKTKVQGWAASGLVKSAAQQGSRLLPLAQDGCWCSGVTCRSNFVQRFHCWWTCRQISFQEWGILLPKVLAWFPHVSLSELKPKPTPGPVTAQEDGISSAHYYLRTTSLWAGERVTFSWVGVTWSKSGRASSRRREGWRGNHKWVLCCRLYFNQSVN